MDGFLPVNIRNRPSILEEIDNHAGQRRLAGPYQFKSFSEISRNVLVIAVGTIASGWFVHSVTIAKLS